MTGNLSMGRNNITQLGDPVRQSDAVHKSYVDDQIRSFSTSQFVNKNGDQMMGDLNMNGRLLRGLPTESRPVYMVMRL